MKHSYATLALSLGLTWAQITDQDQLSSSLASLSAGPATAFADGYTSILYAIQPSPAPTAFADAAATLVDVWNAYPTDPYGGAADLLLSGMTGGQSLEAELNGFGACNSASNGNTQEPTYPVYPQRGSGDAPYDVDENTLRSAIYIPPGFSYGASAPPLLYVPGTGGEACADFAPNFAKTLAGSSFADPVFVNVPQNMLMDIQTNAEFIAYAINYISGISGGSQVAVLTWSQGSLASQWAFKYWPSTRDVTSDLINISSDYHGTVEVPILCSDGIPCAPSILQQDYNSNFVATLRNNGGDSAYVPTTEIHSEYDEIVEPQSGSDASAILNNGNGVAVSNNLIQDICDSFTPAGAPNFGHEGALYNAVAWALVVDALSNDGPADVDRSGAANYCGNFVAPGLVLDDLLATEAAALVSGFNSLAYPNKVTSEPAIKSYAAADQP